MNGDIIPPKRPSNLQNGQPRRRPQPSVRPGVEPQAIGSQPSPVDLPRLDEPLEPSPPQDAVKKRRRLPIFIGGVFLALVAVIAASWVWYTMALSPVDSTSEARHHIKVEPGSSLSSVGDQMYDKGLIRSKLAFSLHARFTGASSNLKAGDYRLSPAESTQKIMEHLMTGSVDEFTITFLPGATLRRLPGETSDQVTDIKSALLKAGYTDSEVEMAFAKEYTHPLLKDKPANADLEGYIYGETYNFTSDSTVEQILEYIFDYYYGVIEQNNLAQGFREQGLTLHEGIALASIIQREVSGDEDRKQVAQIFLDRLDLGMSLGADATFEYAAKKENITPSPDIDSPYNTRKHTGLPPGPIAAPGLSALQAVVTPANGDYLYFVSGDDGTNHFARTLQEHESNVRQYCTELCFGG